MSIAHGCGPYCRDGEHCGLAYTGLRDSRTGQASGHDFTLARWQAEIAASWWRSYGVTVTRIAPAREAPGMADALARGSLRVLVSGPHGPVDGQRWLVWWTLAGQPV